MDVDLLPENVRSRKIAKGVRLHLAEFLPPMPGEPGALAGTSRSLFEILEEVERRIILDMLEHSNWNQTEAAERFQVPLSTLNQKIKRLGIETRRRSTALPVHPKPTRSRRPAAFRQPSGAERSSTGERADQRSYEGAPLAKAGANR